MVLINVCIVDMVYAAFLPAYNSSCCECPNAVSPDTKFVLLRPSFMCS